MNMKGITQEYKTNLFVFSSQREHSHLKSSPSQEFPNDWEILYQFIVVVLKFRAAKIANIETCRQLWLSYSSIPILNALFTFTRVFLFSQ